MKVILRSPALPLLVLGILLKLPVSKVGSRAGREARPSSERKARETSVESDRRRS